jgi:hypothetical protein
MVAVGRARSPQEKKALSCARDKKSKWYTVRWRKWRDAPLADTVERRLGRRERLGMEAPALVKARIDRTRRRRLGRD